MPKKVSDCLPPFFIGLIMMIMVVGIIFYKSQDMELPKHPAFVRGEITDYNRIDYSSNSIDWSKHKRYYAKEYVYSFGDEADENVYSAESPIYGGT